jgi:hypothetical protein
MVLGTYSAVGMRESEVFPAAVFIALNLTGPADSRFRFLSTARGVRWFG